MTDSSEWARARDRDILRKMREEMTVNIIVPVKAIVTQEQASGLAPTGELDCTICIACFALVPLYRLVEHGQKMHPAEGE